MISSTELQVLKKEKEKLEGDNRRWEETQTEKLDSKASNTLEYYKKERTASINRHTEQIKFCISKIEHYEQEKLRLETSLKTYTESSDATISKLMNPTLVRPERIRRNDDRLASINRTISLAELIQSNSIIVNSSDYKPVDMTSLENEDPDDEFSLVNINKRLAAKRAIRLKEINDNSESYYAELERKLQKAREEVEN